MGDRSPPMPDAMPRRTGFHPLSRGPMFFLKSAIMTPLKVFLLAGALTLPVSMTAANAQSQQNGQAVDPMTIAQTVEARAPFQMLALAIEAAGLTEQFEGGEYTVFAPSNEAFGALPKGVFLELLKPENQAALKTVLLQHVVEGTREAGAFIDQTAEVEALAGDTLTVEGEGELILRLPGSPAISMLDGQVIVAIEDTEASVPLVTITLDGMVVPEPAGGGF